MLDYKLKKTILVLAMLLTLLMSCDTEPEISRQEEVTAQLISGGALWNVKEVTIDDVVENTLFANLSIQFEEGTYSSTNGGLVWSPTGTWSFASEDATSFIREDGVEVLIESMTSDELILSLDWPETTLDADKGRTTSRKGRHKFRFGK
ncbi:MAG: hypothetical protein KDC99_17825 [Cyclobacteriaceae bacterium]|nr:hypothetical protein [Cyclobacteriaceae bacterium]